MDNNIKYLCKHSTTIANFIEGYENDENELSKAIDMFETEANVNDIVKFNINEKNALQIWEFVFKYDFDNKNTYGHTIYPFVQKQNFDNYEQMTTSLKYLLYNCKPIENIKFTLKNITNISSGHAFAVNFNVLKIEAGMGGLQYSA